MNRSKIIIHTILLVSFIIVQTNVFAINFTRNNETAQKFGVHEISLTGNGSVLNPFDTPCEVTFTSPAGLKITVNAFYDGNNVWRARCYVNEIGEWSWKSVSPRDYELDNKGGSFISIDSKLRGKLKKHPLNNSALATDDGKWFLNIGDTPYLIFNDNYSKWQEFIKDSWELGITLIRASMVGDLRDWNRIFEVDNYNKLDISNFQTNDTRLVWMINNYPELYTEFILFGECNTGWKSDETFWYNLSKEQKNRIMRYIVARYAAFPEIIWEIVNDYKYSPSHPHNVEIANEVGNYLMNHDPWNHLITTGGIRGDNFYFYDSDWATLFHLESLDALSAEQANEYSQYPVHVFNAEDRYETYKEPDNPKIYFRRLIWAWTLSGGSACYGGDWDDIVPYSQSQFEGLDNIIHVRNFFIDNNIDLSKYVADDNSITSVARGSIRPKVMHTQSKSNYIIYHPNASIDGQGANISSRTATLTINNLPKNEYTLLWMRADNGNIENRFFSHNGGDKFLTSPWQGIDVVLYLQSDSVVGIKETLPLINDNVILKVQPNPLHSTTSVIVDFSRNTDACIQILNSQGILLEKLSDRRFNSGTHKLIWDAKSQSKGIYFIKVKTGDQVLVKRIILL